MYKTKITSYGKQANRMIHGKMRRVWIKRLYPDFKRGRYVGVKYSIKVVNKKLKKVI